jgi:hypothetical protein
VTVSVNVPDALAPEPETNVWKFPKLDPVGVFSDVDPSPVKLIINALPAPPENVTEFDPLPVQPTHVNVPEVVKVTGSALATVAATVITPRIRSGMKMLLIAIFILSILVILGP